MRIACHEPAGYEGALVTIEVDIRRGIPAVDLVGLPGDSVRESRERVRAAMRNSGFEFPLDRVLINLSPASMPKVGTAYDLPIALAVMVASGQLPEPGIDAMALGELMLGGEVLPVRGVLAAVAAGLAAGFTRFIVPSGNEEEARALGKGRILPMERLGQALDLFLDLGSEGKSAPPAQARPLSAMAEDLADIRGQAVLKRALEIAAAGSHHILLFGPPGSGKTMAARRLPGLLPDLDATSVLERARLFSLAGLLTRGYALDARPPFRSPHHSASLEGLIGGGRAFKPGEISLAHKGVLFLDEAPEFRVDALQALREPIEEGRIAISRAEAVHYFPAEFQLALAANPCPCGNLGRAERVCVCSVKEITRYWKRLGGPLLDRIDIRVPVMSTGPGEMRAVASESSAVVAVRVKSAISIQEDRFRGLPYRRNARIPPAAIDRFCPLDDTSATVLDSVLRGSGLSTRAAHSVIKTARTIADLDGGRDIRSSDIDEAFFLRKYGDIDLYWRLP